VLAFGGHGGTFGAAAAVAFTTGLLGAVIVLQQAAPTPASALLTLYEGSASVSRAGGAGSEAAHSGDTLSAGQTLETGDHTKASLTYPNLAHAMLDSESELHLNSVSRGVSGAMTIDASQPFGKTWHTLSRLAQGSTYVIRAPNSTTAEVRGTEFEVIVEIVNGLTIVRINVFSGIVAVTANGVTVILSAGESTTITSGEPPSAAAPISDADRQDSFTVFNETLDKTQGVPVSVTGDHFSPPQSTGLIDGPLGDGSSDLEFTLGWPGSKFELDVYRPDGTAFADLASGAPPISLTAYQAEAGVWRYRVTDIVSRPAESWWVIVTRITPSRLSQRPSSTTANPATIQTAGTTAPVPLAARPTASPSPQPSPAASPQGSPAPSPQPSPAASPQPSPAPSPQPSPAASPQPSPAPPASPSPSTGAAPGPTPAPSPEPSPSPPSASPPPASPPPASPPPASPPPPTPSGDGVTSIRGDGSILAAGGGSNAMCASARGAQVRFKLRASYSTAGAPEPTGGISLAFSTSASCTPGQTGSQTYDLTSSQLSAAGATSGTTVLVFRSLDITDETVPGKAGRIVVECSRWTLRVIVSGSGPRAVALAFTVVDGDGTLVWTSGQGSLVGGSVGPWA